MIVAFWILMIVCLVCVLYIRRQQAQLRELRRSDRRKIAFFRALTREIRPPLHSVSGLAEVISREDLYLSKSEKRNISALIQYNTNLISTMLDELSILAEKNSRGHVLQDERFSPNNLSLLCLEANRANAREGVKLSFKRTLSDEFCVSADRHVVELILNKLLSCACRFTEKGEIVLGCECERLQHLLTFYVEDTGTNVPEHRRKLMFEWLEKLDDLVDETEFDLSVAYSLATRIGGYLKLDEDYLSGTRMVLTLPVR